VSCGICVGSCPTATPFRRATAPIPGIQLPALTVEELRSRVIVAAKGLVGNDRVLAFSCDHANKADKLNGPGVAVVNLPCVAMLPPSFIDYVLSRGLTDGVAIAGCRDGECYFRFGVRWTEARLNGERDPHLRARVPRQRIARIWAAPTEWRRLESDLADFRARLRAMTEKEAAE
jgi:coenzyme F420-reducing hydrogenase delta subunit